MGSSGDEKEVSEPSLRKLIEDHELAERNNRNRAQTTTVTHLHENEATPLTEQLYIDVSCSEPAANDFPPGSDVIIREPAELEWRDGETRITRSRTNENSERRESGDGLSEKERKMLEFEQEKEFGETAKCDVDAQQNEKSPEGGCGRLRENMRNKPQPGCDPDELYRLPTEHLRFDRDYSNERIKSKRVVSAAHAQRPIITWRRDEIDELNERLREASLDGAVGGDDLLTSAYPFDTEGERLLQYQLGTWAEVSEVVDNHTIELTSQAPLQQLTPSIPTFERSLPSRLLPRNDVFSSSEDIRASPRAGAKPKKSPRKQKAL